MDCVRLPARLGALTRLHPLLLFIVAASLAGLTALELQPDLSPDFLDDPPMATRQAHDPAPATGSGIGAEGRQDWVDAILARPLFSPDRRPAATAAAAPGETPSALPRLAGILLDGPRRSVIFAASGDTRPTVVREGGQLGEFKVQTVEATQVTILAPDGPHILRPSFDPRPPTPPASPAIPGLPNFQSLNAIPGRPSLPVAR